MKSRRIRRWLVLFVLVATSISFVWYLATHPEQITQLKETSPVWLILILLTNIGGMAAVVGLYQVLVRMVGVRLQATENMLLTIYSSIANFLGPLQSGPGVRAAYASSPELAMLARSVRGTERVLSGGRHAPLVANGTCCVWCSRCKHVSNSVALQKK